jgi:hypothetical protein
MSVSHSVSKDDPYTQYTTFESAKPSVNNQFIKYKIDSTSIDELVALSKDLIIQKHNNPNVFNLQMAKSLPKYDKLTKPYPIIMMLILEADIYTPKGFRNYLIYLSKKHKVIQGIDVWYKDHVDYAKTQVEYIKCVMRSNGVSTGTKTAQHYLKEMYKAIDADIKKIMDLDKRLKTEITNSTVDIDKIRKRIAETVPFIIKNNITI